MPSENNQVSAHELTITKISNLKSLKAEDDVASDPEQLQYVVENKTAPATSQDEFCDEKQNTGTFFMTDAKKTIKATLNEELTLKVPKKRKVKKSRKRP